MEIGIKFCGGCNPVFDRGRRLRRFMETHPEHTYITSDASRICDLWMVICGCSRICAETGGLKARWKTAVLWSEDGFQKLEQEMEEFDAGAAPSFEKSCLTLGDRVTERYLIGDRDVELFGTITRDKSRLHNHQPTAVLAGFEKPPVYGMFLDSLVSAVMGSRLPGSGTIYMEHTTRFIRPVYVGDEIEIQVDFLECQEEKDCYVGRFRGSVRNQRGERVLTADCRQKMMKELFEVRQAAGKKG